MYDDQKEHANMMYLVLCIICFFLCANIEYVKWYMIQSSQNKVLSVLNLRTIVLFRSVCSSVLPIQIDLVFTSKRIKSEYSRLENQQIQESLKSREIIISHTYVLPYTVL